ncbi:MAG: TldD/PmbA family protein [Nitrospirae bacterium]|nr:TldD/PmbA family protein [Nitrospirota bacterium]
MDIASLAQDAIKQAQRKGADAAEIFIKASKKLTVEAKEGKVDALEAANDWGIAIRVIKKQRLGFSFSTRPEELKQSVEKAVEGTTWTEADQYNDIPAYCLPESVSVLDRDIRNISEENDIKNALMLEQGAITFDNRIKKIRKAAAIFTASDTAIYNSKGVNISYASSLVTAYTTAFASDGQDSQTGWDFAISRKLNDIDFALIGANASKMAIELLGAKKISSVKTPIILDSSTACNFLGILSASLSAEAVQKKKSFLAGKVGKAIISPLINVIDDGLMPWGTGTKPVDDEGTPGSKKTLISEGRLTGFIHNTYTASKDNVKSTGNAVRGNFKSLPGVDVTNLYIEPPPTSLVIARDEVPKQSHSFGAVPEDEIASPEPALSDKTRFFANAQNDTSEGARNDRLVKSVSKGILILDAMGVHTANPISGDFSIGISGLWIENGEPVYPIKEAIISGNILDLFKKVEGVGSDLRFYGNIGSPSLLIGEMDISA